MLSIFPYVFACVGLAYGIYQHCHKIKEERLANELSKLLDKILQIDDFSTPEAHGVVIDLITTLQKSRGIRDFEFLDQEKKISLLRQLLEA